MRFRANFPIIQVVCALVWLVLIAGSWHKGPGRDGFFLAAIILGLCTSLLHVATFFTTYWELDAQRLREYRLWHIREISYPHIVAVTSRGAKWSRARAIEVTFGELGSALDPRSTITATPADREKFLSALRARAPQAEFPA